MSRRRCERFIRSSYRHYQTQVFQPIQTNFLEVIVMIRNCFNLFLREWLNISLGNSVKIIIKGDFNNQYGTRNSFAMFLQGSFELVIRALINDKPLPPYEITLTHVATSIKTMTQNFLNMANQVQVLQDILTKFFQHVIQYPFTIPIQVLATYSCDIPSKFSCERLPIFSSGFVSKLCHASKVSQDNAKSDVHKCTSTSSVSSTSTSFGSGLLAANAFVQRRFLGKRSPSCHV